MLLPETGNGKPMTTSQPEYCAAFNAIERAYADAQARGEPLMVEEAMAIIYQHGPTRREIEEISKELSFGDRSITDVEIARRLRFPLGFTQKFLLIIKAAYGDGAADPANEPAPKPTLN